MGWTGIQATHFKNGQIDRKREMDERWTQTEHDGYPQLTVLKSSMVGTVYYAAVEIKRNGKVEKVFGTTALTSTLKHNAWYYEFCYKDIDETMGPCDCKCPQSILKLLTPTENEYAIAWRKRCEEYHANKKTEVTPGSLPIGTKIRFKFSDGREFEAVKMASRYPNGKAWWYIPSANAKVSSKYIKNFEIVG